MFNVNEGRALWRVLSFTVVFSLFPLLAFADSFQEMRFYNYRVNPFAKYSAGSSITYVKAGTLFRKGDDLGSRSGRVRWLEDWVRGSLKKQIVQFFESDHWEALRESSCRSWGPLSKIPAPDLLDDIQNSSYSLKKECVDQNGIHREGMTRIGIRADEICLDIPRIVDGVSQWETPWIEAKMIALAIHESIHHFGYWDADHALLEQLEHQITVMKTVRLPTPNRLTVTSTLKRLRDSFREGVEPGIPEGSTSVDLRCGQIEISPSETKTKRREALSRFGTYSANSLSVSPSIVGGNRLAVTHGSDPALILADGLKRPSFASMDVSLNAWLFDSFGAFDPVPPELLSKIKLGQKFPGELLGTLQGLVKPNIAVSEFFQPAMQVFPVARQVAPNRLVLEWLGTEGAEIMETEEERNTQPRLPSALFSGRWVSGYSECEVLNPID